MALPVLHAVEALLHCRVGIFGSWARTSAIGLISIDLMSIGLMSPFTISLRDA